VDDLRTYLSEETDPDCRLALQAMIDDLMVVEEPEHDNGDVVRVLHTERATYVLRRGSAPVDHNAPGHWCGSCRWKDQIRQWQEWKESPPSGLAELAALGGLSDDLESFVFDD
jgi:hypothetical protein